VLRPLFARSGNVCAYPGCTAVLIDDENGLVGEVCHIEAAEPRGARFNPNQSDDERRGYTNLLVLCHPHHIETNKVDEYTVERLKGIKAAHERQFKKNQYKIDETALYKISFQMEEYWSKIAMLHRERHVVPNLALPVATNASYFQLMDQAEEHISGIRSWSGILAKSDDALYAELVALLEVLGLPASSLDDHRDKTRRFQRRNWEMWALAIPNITARLRAALVQMELQYLEQYLKLNAGDEKAKGRLEARQLEFERIATSHGLAD
jgi:hypothetical protein